MTKKKIRIVVFGLVIVLFSAAIFFLNHWPEKQEVLSKVFSKVKPFQNAQTPRAKRTFSKKSRQVDSSGVQEDSSGVQEDSSSRQAIRSYVLRESLKVGRVVDEPNKEEKRLQEYARNLLGEQVEELSRLSRDKSLNNDIRFVSAYILSLSRDKKSLPALVEVAQSPLTESPTVAKGRFFVEEVMIRSQALAGIAGVRPKELAIFELKKYIKSQENVLLAREARRLLIKLKEESL